MSTREDREWDAHNDRIADDQEANGLTEAEEFAEVARIHEAPEWIASSPAMRDDMRAYVQRLNGNVSAGEGVGMPPRPTPPADPTRELAAHIWEAIDDDVIRGRLYRVDCDRLVELVVAAGWSPPAERCDEDDCEKAGGRVTEDGPVRCSWHTVVDFDIDPEPVPPADANAPGLREVWSALVEFASKHGASLATAGEDPRAPEFTDDWCAFVEKVRALLATQPDKAEGEA